MLSGRLLCAGWLKVSLALFRRIVAQYGLWKYRNVHVSRGGPIRKISFRYESGKYHAFAWLDATLRLKSSLGLYDDLDGTGTSEFLSEALCKL